MKLGIFNDETDVYNAETHIRNSVLKKIIISPAHFQEAQTASPKRKKAFDKGTVVHDVLLEQRTDRFMVIPEDAPSKPTKAQRNAKKPSPKTVEDIAWWDAFLADNAGKILIDEDLNASLERRLETFTSSQTAMDCYRDGKIEQSHYVQDPETGLYFKIRPDIDQGDSLSDLKTTSNMKWFHSDVMKFGYHFQAGFYSLVRELSTGQPVKKFNFIAQETEAPFGVRVFELNEDELDKCKKYVRGFINQASVCIRENVFKSYDDIKTPLVLPDSVMFEDLFMEAI